MLRARALPCHGRGATLVEILVTLLILALGLLGLSGMIAKSQSAELAAYQRIQATALMAGMAERIKANRSQAASYASVDGSGNPVTVGTGDSQPASCTSLALGVQRDLCEWSNAMKGAGEALAGNRVGAMEGARGCIVQVQASDASVGVCLPGIYRVTVVWQGTEKTVAPADQCGKGLYGVETQRRAISTQVSIGLNSCS